MVVSVPESVLIDQRHHSGVPTLSSFPARRPRKPGTPFLDGASVVCSHQLAVPTRSGQTLRPLFVTSGAAGRGNPLLISHQSSPLSLRPPVPPISIIVSFTFLSPPQNHTRHIRHLIHALPTPAHRLRCFSSPSPSQFGAF